MNKQQHIVFLTPGFAKDEADSYTIPAMQIFLSALKKQFSGKLSIISFQFPREAKNYAWNDIDVYALGGNNSKIKKLIVWKKAKTTFSQLNKELPVTHIHSFWMGECAYIASKLADRYNIPHSCTLMGQDVLTSNNYFKKIKKLPNLITLSKFHSNKLQKNHQISSTIIPWGIQLNQLNTIEKTIDLIVVSSLISLKCVHEFIETVSSLKEQHPNITCKIVGDGPLRKEIEQQIESLKLSGNIELLGILTYHETQQLIAQSKILVHLSSFESFGMVTIEALAANTMVIAKPVGIAKEINEVIKIKAIDEAVSEIKQIRSSQPKNTTVNYAVENTVKQYLHLFNE